MSVTLTILTQPFTYSVLNSECWYQLDSPQSYLSDFTYTYKVKTYDPYTLALNKDLGLFNSSPKPNTGDGIFSPHKILKTQIPNGYPISYDVGMTAVSAFTQSVLPYNIQYGFQYSPGFTFSVSEVFSSVTLNTGTAIDLLPFDTISLQMDNLGLNPQYNTQAIVVNVIGTQYVTSIPYGMTPSFGVETGTVTNLSRTVGTSSIRFGFNGTRQYTQRYDDFSSYVVEGSGADYKFLTNYHTSSVAPKEIYMDQSEIQGILMDKSATASVGRWLKIETFDENYNSIDAFYIDSAITITSNYRYYAVPTGTRNLQAMGVDFTGVTYYKLSVCVRQTTPPPFPIVFYVEQATIWRKIVSNCSPYDNTRIMFINRMGGYEFYNFSLDSKQTTNVDKSNYRKVLPWNYSIGDRQDTVLAMKAQDSYTVNSNWISEYDYRILGELITSSDVYVVDEYNNLFPIVITDTDWTYKTQLRDILYNAVITYKIAYDINLQNL